MARVIGQVYIGIYGNVGVLSHFPEWKHWYSGVLPYPVLLLSQILIIQLLTLMAYDYTRGIGFFFIESTRLRKVVRYFALLYFASMLVRLVWFNGDLIIPILFHCILALFLFVYSFPGKPK
jgi:hypothetical protein